MPESSASLKELCRICNTPNPKYRCPACDTKTCSLPCYKRHQNWSQCSGKRDPAAYVKRSQLATAAGIDHDFNFLTRIERSIDAKNKPSLDQALSPTGKPGRDVSLVPGSNLERVISHSNIHIHRAPRGMTRQKQNRTRWHPKHKCVQWTVEWILPDGSIEIQQCLDNTPLLNSFNALASRRTSKRRKLGPGIDETPEPPYLVPSTSTPHEHKSDNHLKPSASAETPSRPITCQSFSVDDEKSPAASQISPNRVAEPPPPGPTQERSPGSHNAVEICPTLPTAKSSTLGQQLEIAQPSFESVPAYFYLIKPMTRGKARALVSLDPSTSLAASLRNQAMLEFPSIQVLKEGPDFLAEEYALADKISKDKSGPTP